MQMARFDRKAALAGAVLALVGGYVAWSSLGFRLGSASRMGAGYFPLIVGISLIALGAVLGLSALRGGEWIGRVAWRPCAAVLAGMVLFALAMPRLGLIPAVAALVAVSAAGDADMRPLPALALTVGVAVGSWLLFGYVLRLPVPPVRLAF